MHPAAQLRQQLLEQRGNTHAILAVGLLAGALALAIVRRWRPVVFLLVLMFGKLTLFLAAAATTGRDRPDVPQLDAHLPTSSYPSGHFAASLPVRRHPLLIVPVPGPDGAG